MKKVLLFVFSFVIIFSLCGTAFAIEKVRVKLISGEVAAVDAAANSLTIKGKRAEVVITTTEKTSVVLSKAKRALADIKIGDKVTVKYSEIEGKSVAKTVEIKPVKTSNDTDSAKQPKK